MDLKEMILQKAFYDRNPIEVAKDLLGKFLVRKIGNKYQVGMISETEAYLPEGDEASHNFIGKAKDMPLRFYIK